jgi:hypothetical protein
MQMIRVLEKTGKDGMLCLRIPLGKADSEYEVVLVVQPRENLMAASIEQGHGWPPGYFDKTFGSIEDESFVRPPQGEPGKPVELD